MGYIKSYTETDPTVAAHVKDGIDWTEVTNIPAGIADGDLVVVNRYRTPREGDTIVALIDNSDATIKTLYRRDELVELRPANRALQPQIYSPDRVAVNGVVVGVLRKY